MLSPLSHVLDSRRLLKDLAEIAGPLWLSRGIVHDEAYKFLEELRLLETPPPSLGSLDLAVSFFFVGGGAPPPTF